MINLHTLDGVHKMILLLYVLMYDVEVRCNALRCSMHAIRYTIHTFHETLVVIPTKMNEGIGIGKYLNTLSLSLFCYWFRTVGNEV